MDRLVHSIVALALGVLCAAASAQSPWSQVFPKLSPEKRNSHAMAFDAARGVVVLYGGNYGSLFRQGTWTWNGKNWQQVTSSGGPGAKSNATMVWHPERKEILLVGGNDGRRLRTPIDCPSDRKHDRRGQQRRGHGSPKSRA